MKSRYVLAVIILAVFYSASPVNADSVDFSGHLQTGLSVFPGDIANINALDLQMRWQFFDSVRLTMDLNHEWVMNLERGEDRFQTTPTEYYLDYNSKTGTWLRVGKQKLTTGLGVFWNPTNFFSPWYVPDDTATVLRVDRYATGNTWFITTSLCFNKDYAVEIGMEQMQTGYQAGVKSFFRKKEIALGLNFIKNFLNEEVYIEGAVDFNAQKTSWLIGINYLFNLVKNGMIYVEYFQEERPSVEGKFLGLGVNYSPVEKVLLNGNAIFHLEAQEIVFYPEIRYIINDSWELHLKKTYVELTDSNTYIISLLRFF